MKRIPNDCMLYALSKSFNWPYDMVYYLCVEWGLLEGEGVPFRNYILGLRDMGFDLYFWAPRMNTCDLVRSFPKSTAFVSILQPGKEHLPGGRHLIAIKNGLIIDGDHRPNKPAWETLLIHQIVFVGKPMPNYPCIRKITEGK